MVKKILLGIAAISVLFLVINTAGCIYGEEPNFDFDILNLESDDGIYWTAYIVVTNLDTQAINCNVEYTFMDTHGNEIGSTTQNIGTIAKGSHKSTHATIKSNRYVEEAYVNVVCEATFK